MASKNNSHHHKNAKAVLGFLIVILAFGILMLFVDYKDNLDASNHTQLFIILSAIGLALLTCLYFLANNSSKGNISFYKEIKEVRVSKSSKSKSSKSKKKKRSR